MKKTIRKIWLLVVMLIVFAVCVFGLSTSNGIDVSSGGINVTGTTTLNSGVSVSSGLNTTYTGTEYGVRHYTNVGATANQPFVNLICDNVGFDQNCLYIRQDGSARALQVINEGSSVTAGHVAFFDHSNGSNTNYAIFGRTDANGANYFYRNLPAASTAGSVVKIIDINAFDDQPALDIRQYGTGAIQEWWNGTARAGYILPNGSFYAKGGYKDFTPWLNRQNVLEDLRKIGGSNGKINHSSLPEGTHEIVRETILNETGGIIGYQEVGTRDLGAMITFLTQVNQELLEKTEILERELCKKDNTYIWCK